MKSLKTVVAALALCAATPLHSSQPAQFEPVRAPLYFEPNLGQTHPEVKFVGRGGGMTMLLTADGAVLKLARYHRAEHGKIPQAEAASLRMRLKGINTGARAELLDEQPGITAYFIGNDPKKWIGRVPHYGKVRYRELYSGIDLVYYRSGHRVEYDFEVKPWADPTSIRLAYEGADRMRLDPAGDLVLETRVGKLRQHKPRVYQDAGGRRVEIAANYRLEGNGVTFALGRYDRSRPLLIDPVVSYATVLGGNSGDIPQAIAVDTTGAAYAGGLTTSLDFPVTSGAAPLAEVQGFITKFEPHTSGNVRLAYSIIMGTSVPGTVAVISSLATDAAGSVYACARAGGLGFPVVNNHRPPATGNSSYAVKVNPYSGSGPVTIGYSTPLSAGGFVAADPFGGAYFAGSTGPADAEVLNGFQNQRQGTDVWVTKLNPHSGGIVTVAYASYFGGSGEDLVWGLGVDPGGAAYIAGTTTSSDLPLVRAYQTYPGNRGNLFLAKVNPYSGIGAASLGYSTYFGTGRTGGVAVGLNMLAVDITGGAYLLGSTGDPSTLPVTNAFTPNVGNFFLAGFAPLSGTGSVQLTFCTRLEGESWSHVATDASGALYAAGEQIAKVVRMRTPLRQASLSIVKFQRTGGTYSRAWVTTYPTPPAEAMVQGLATDGAGSAYLIASLYAPTGLANSYLTPLGGYDALVIKFKEGVPGAPTFLPVTSSPSGVSFTVSGTACNPGTYSTPVTLTLPVGGDCLFTWPDGINQTATQRLGFNDWVDGSPLNPRTITPAGPSSLGANYLPQFFVSLRTRPGAAGKIVNQFGPIESGFQFQNQVLGLTPEANTCFQFLRWSGDLSGTQVPYQLSVAGPMNIEAIFSGYFSAGPAVTAVPGAIRYNQTTGRYVQAVTVTNVSADVVTAMLAVDNLAAGAQLFSPSGLTTACTAPAGVSYRDIGILSPGQRVTVQLEFTKPATVSLTYAPRVMISLY